MLGEASLACGQTVQDSQMTDSGDAPAVMKEDWKSQWFVQAGADVTLQLPYGHKASNTFKKGMSLGADVAVGRWFTPEVGMMAKLNWENGIIDSRADWIAPFGDKGANHSKGGYFFFVCDVPVDVHNLIWGYKADRVWNMQVFPRSGVTYNFGVSKGSPLIGVGVGNTFRVSDKCKVYCNIAYNGVSSGHTGVETGTGIGSGSNGFVNADIGVQYTLGSVGKKSEAFGGYSNTLHDNKFWRNCFVEMGADMTMLAPYRKPIKDTFPHGCAMGINVGIGKWFSPVYALRGRLNWVNVLIENPDADWYAYDSEKHTSNFDGNGCMLAYMDVMLSMKHALLGYQEGENWDLYIFPRCGLGSNRSLGSMSPLIGAGAGGSYRLNDSWSLYAETSVMGTTSEFFSGVSGTGMGVSTSFNGILDFQVGVRLNLGSKKFR